jgi:hypothetical protein
LDLDDKLQVPGRNVFHDSVNTRWISVWKCRPF